jgi:hypothetical protein
MRVQRGETRASAETRREGIAKMRFRDVLEAVHA